MTAPLAVIASELVDRWRDTGPVLWVGAGAAALVWLLLLGLLAMKTEPRRVPAGPATLDPGGPEPPAVVSLITTDWELGHEAVPATLLDLAARRFVSIDWIGERTLVRVRNTASGALAEYEQLVLDHVKSLSTQTADGFVPADALTTGPDAVAKSWWRRFEKSVCKDARSRGLSRPRWGARAKSALTIMAIAVGLAVGIAATTLPRDEDNDDPIGAAIGFAVISAAALVGIASQLRGERDTTDGRGSAARWLGLRTMLADDPTFGSQPPAAVAIWDRMIAYGAGMGVAQAAVAALPLGAESEREAWSPVGGRWRVVRIRYPRRIPPGYGRHPALVALVGLLLASIGVVVAPASIAASRALLDAIRDVANDNGSDVPAGLTAAIGVVLAIIVSIGALVALFGFAMLFGGFADLFRRRRVIEGRVLRLRARGDDEHRFWHVAVDDGTSNRVRAWRMQASPPVHQGGITRARVSPWLHHVADMSMVRDTVDTLEAATPAVTAAFAAPGLAAAPPPPPPLPDAATVSAALGVPVVAEPNAARHPLALGGASATYVAPEGGRLIVAWIRPEMLAGFRHMPRFLAAAVPGIGDEAYRAPAGGGVVARVDEHVLLVTPSLPGLNGDARDQAVDAVAHAATTLGAAR